MIEGFPESCFLYDLVRDSDTFSFWISPFAVAVTAALDFTDEELDFLLLRLMFCTSLVEDIKFIASGL